MSGSGELRLYDVRQTHAGPLFDVFRAHCGGRHIAIKRRAAILKWEAAIASSWQLTSQTRLLSGTQLDWPPEHPALDTAYADRLLRAEHALIAQVAIDWNHPGCQLARWAPDDVLHWSDRDDAGTLCLITPWCDGEPLSALPREVQRRLFPTMLPALWRALGECPHGNLSPSSLLVERRRWFRILDPGTRIVGPATVATADPDTIASPAATSPAAPTSPAAATSPAATSPAATSPAATSPAATSPAATSPAAATSTPAAASTASSSTAATSPAATPDPARAPRTEALALTSSLFTTNPTHYPLLAPEHGPGWPHLHAASGGLVQILERLTEHPQLAFLTCDPRSVPLDALGLAPPPPYTPAAADVFACGVIYFEILAGAPLSSLLALDAPLWTRASAELSPSELARHREAVTWCITQLTGGAIRRALEPVGAARPEITLCERLLLLDLNTAALAALVAEIGHLAV